MKRWKTSGLYFDTWLKIIFPLCSSTCTHSNTETVARSAYLAGMPHSAGHSSIVEVVFCGDQLFSVAFWRNISGNIFDLWLGLNALCVNCIVTGTRGKELQIRLTATDFSTTLTRGTWVQFIISIFQSCQRGKEHSAPGERREFPAAGFSFVAREFLVRILNCVRAYWID